MDCVINKDFCVSAGATFHPTVRWGTDELSAVPITAISQTAPAVITAPGHGVPPGWPVAVVSAHGMSQINATRYPPQGADWHRATIVSADQVAFNDVNSADFSAYASGGFLVFSTPMALDGMTLGMSVYDNPNHTGTPLVTLAQGVGIFVDPHDLTIIPELQTAGLAWNLGYYVLDATDSGGVVTRLLTGTITIN